MKEQYSALFIMCTIGWIIEGFLIQTDSYVRKNDYGDLLCNEGQISTIQDIRNVLTCAKACALHSKCSSFFYNRNKTCYLHNTIIYSTMPCIGVAETFYYVRKDYLQEISTSLLETTALENPLLETTSTSATVNLSCPDQWLSIGAGCYQVTPGESKQTWENAKSICISNGGYLASMETEEENKLLKEYVSALGSSDYFIGGSDLEIEGTFKWDHSGDLVNLPPTDEFHDWYPPNQPDNGGTSANQHCMVFYGVRSHLWNDVSCTYARFFICEIDPV